MTIEFKEGRYMAGIWFIAYEEKDVIATMYTDESYVDGKTPMNWRFDYRFRYYDPDDPGNDAWSGKDKKSFYSAESEKPRSEEDLLKEAHAAMGFIAKETGGKVYFCPLFTADPMAAMEVLKKQPWVHAKTVSKEEYEKEYGKTEEKEN